MAEVRREENQGTEKEGAAAEAVAEGDKDLAKIFHDFLCSDVLNDLVKSVDAEMCETLSKVSLFAQSVEKTCGGQSLHVAGVFHPVEIPLEIVQVQNDDGGGGGKKTENEKAGGMGSPPPGEKKAAPPWTTPAPIGLGKGKDMNLLRKYLGREDDNEDDPPVESFSGSSSGEAEAESGDDFKIGEGEGREEERGERQSKADKRKVSPLRLNLRARKKTPSIPEESPPQKQERRQKKRSRQELEKNHEQKKPRKTDPTPKQSELAKVPSPSASPPPPPKKTTDGLTGPLNAPPPSMAKKKTASTFEELYFVALEVHGLSVPPNSDPLCYGRQISWENKKLLDSMKVTGIYRFEEVERTIIHHVRKGASLSFRQELLGFLVESVLLYLKVKTKRYADLRARLSKRRKNSTLYLPDLRLLSEQSGILRGDKKEAMKLSKMLKKDRSSLTVPSIIDCLQTCRQLIQRNDDFTTKKGARLRFLDKYE